MTEWSFAGLNFWIQPNYKMKEKIIKIQCKGPEIEHTNFWDTEMGIDTYMFSYKDGCMRLLVPKCRNIELLDMVQSEYVVASRLRSIEGEKFAIELLFEDNSQDQFCIFMDAISSVGPFPSADEDELTERKLTIWAEGGYKVAELPLYIRYAPKLPWLEPLE